MDLNEVKKIYQNLNDEELIKIARNEADEYEPEAVQVALEELSSRGVEEVSEPEQQLKQVIQPDTVSYYLEGVFRELTQVAEGCNDGELDDSRMQSHIQNALFGLNAAYNLRYLSGEQIEKLSKNEWEKYTLPPKALFDNARFFEEE